MTVCRRRLGSNILPGSGVAVMLCREAWHGDVGTAVVLVMLVRGEVLAVVLADVGIERSIGGLVVVKLGWLYEVSGWQK